MIYGLTAIFLIGINWILYYGYFFYTNNQKKSIIYDYFPRISYALDVDQQYRVFIHFVRFFFYVLILVILIGTHPDIIDSWFYYINVFLDLFVVVPAIVVSSSILGLTVFIFYIMLRSKSEYVYNINKDDRVAFSVEILEAFFWWAVLYRIMDFKYGNYNTLVAIGISLAYVIAKLAQYIHVLKTVFPFYMCVYWFISMFFSCLLLTLSENILIPILFSTLLFYFLANNWGIVFPKPKFSRKKSE